MAFSSLHMLFAAAAALVPFGAGMHSNDPAAVPAPGETAETLDYGYNRTQRMTVPISIGGSGPFRFIIDTGSERTVLSRELAARLSLAEGRPVNVSSMTDVARVSTAMVPALRVGRRTIEDIQAPLLWARNLGADGLLGVDSLESQRVDLDFRTNQITLTPSRRRGPTWDGETITVTARSRLGRLILVDASVDGERVWVILDTGAQVSIGNNALRRRLESRRRLPPTRPLRLISVTGGTLDVDYTVTRKMVVAGIEIFDLPIGFGDAEPFRKLDLLDRPAMLLGMDALRLFQRVSLDFATRRVRLLLPPRSARQARG